MRHAGRLASAPVAPYPVAMQKFLIAVGILLVVLGACWPWIQKLGLGRLPGDVVIEQEDLRFYFPITTMIVVSILLTVVFWLFRK